MANAPDPAAFDLVAVGFWVDRGHPDQKSMDYMKRISGKKVFSFFTLGAKPKSAHAFKCAYTAASYYGAGCEHIGSWHCQGAIDPKLIEQMRKMPKVPGNPHAATPAEMKRVGFARRPTHMNATSFRRRDFAAFALTVAISAAAALWQSTVPQKPSMMGGRGKMPPRAATASEASK